MRISKKQAATLLLGWGLIVYFGKYVPKDGGSANLGMAEGYGPIFDTEEECTAAGKKAVSDFYTEARKSHEKIAVPTRYKCKRRASN